MIRPRQPTTSQTMTSSKSNVVAVSGSRRASFGMTLIELLVVIAILGTLAVTVLPSFGTTTESRRSQEAARVVASFISKSHSAAIGQLEWSGISITPVAAQASYATEIFGVSVPPTYRGDTIDASVAVQPSASSQRTALPSSACPILNPTPSTSPAELFNAAAVGAVAGDLVRFDGMGPFYELVSLNASAMLFQMRGGTALENVGQTLLDTAWPGETPVTHTFEILRQPVRSGAPLPLPDSRVIDLYWSGYGPAGDYATYTAFTTPGEAISVVFDGTGRVRQILRNGSRFSVSMPIFFLVGRADRAAKPAAQTLSAADDSLGANWQYSDSWWIVIDPLSGLVRSAQCKPNGATVTESQEFVRNGLL